MINAQKRQWRKENNKVISKKKAIMEVLKIATAGSVDDGKSTLIGRLLYDTKSLTDDKIEAIERSSRQKGYDYLDFSLATDGLVAEREQGITIDVAHIYFSTNTRSYIIADTPGHVEYTRNMVTGASTSQAAIILIDARHGVIEQTYRHFFINNLLRVKDVIVAVNKMDLVDYSEDRYYEIIREFQALAKKSDYEDQNITYIPVSALHGDNVVSGSDNMDWYSGESLLSHLERLDTQDIYNTGTTRFPVQFVIRPKTSEYHDFRGYAGKVYGGTISKGDDVVILPSQTKSKVKDIMFYDQEYETAARRSSITLTLEDDVNVSRGDMIVREGELPSIDKRFTATVSWMDTKQLTAGSKYIIQHGVNKVLAKVSTLNSLIHTDFSGEDKSVQGIGINDIASVSFQLNKPIFFDAFKEHRTNGSFIIIDPISNSTVGVGFIQK